MSTLEVVDGMPLAANMLPACPATPCCMQIPLVRWHRGMLPGSLSIHLQFNCRKWHPDRNKDDKEKAEQKFTEVSTGDNTHLARLPG